MLEKGRKVALLEPNAAFFTVLAVPEIPEASTVALLAAGMLPLAVAYRRRYRREAAQRLSFAIVPAQ